MRVSPLSLILPTCGFALVACVPMHDDFHRYFSGRLLMAGNSSSYEKSEPRDSAFCVGGKTEEVCVVFVLTDDSTAHSLGKKAVIGVSFDATIHDRPIDGHAFVKVFSKDENGLRLPESLREAVSQGYATCSGAVSGDWTDNGHFRMIYDIRSEGFDGVSLKGCYETHRGWALRPLVPWVSK